MIPGLDPATKDWLQAGAWAAAAIGALVAAVKFWSELRMGREQRARDLRWKQAEAGKSLNDEMLEDPLAWPALQMLDFEGKKFKLPSRTRVAIAYPDIRRALDPPAKTRGEKDTYISECFDSLFYYLSFFHHYTKSTLILREDVAYPLDYYIPLLIKLRPEVDHYLERYGLSQAQAFLETYPVWKAPTSVVAAP